MVIHTHYAPTTERAMMSARRFGTLAVHAILLILLENFVPVGFRVSLAVRVLHNWSSAPRTWDRLRTLRFRFIFWHVGIDVFYLYHLWLIFYNLLLQWLVFHVWNCGSWWFLSVWGANNILEFFGQFIDLILIIYRNKARFSRHTIGMGPQHKEPKEFEDN